MLPCGYWLVESGLVVEGDCIRDDREGWVLYASPMRGYLAGLEWYVNAHFVLVFI